MLRRYVYRALSKGICWALAWSEGPENCSSGEGVGARPSQAARTLLRPLQWVVRSPDQGHHAGSDFDESFWRILYKEDTLKQSLVN